MINQPHVSLLPLFTLPLLFHSPNHYLTFIPRHLTFYSLFIFLVLFTFTPSLSYLPLYLHYLFILSTPLPSLPLHLIYLFTFTSSSSYQPLYLHSLFILSTSLLALPASLSYLPSNPFILSTSFLALPL